MKFAFISEQKVAFPIAVLCRVLLVSTSGYYASQTRPESEWAKRERELGVHVTAAFKEFKGRYGSPRILRELRKKSQRTGRKRIARIMRAKGLVARIRRRFRCTTDSKHDHPIAPNRLKRKFTIARPNRVWVTDITFIRTKQGWLYLAAVLDLFSRRVVGWATSTNVDRHLALAALGQAVASRSPRPGLIHHSDRGSTYAADDYRKALRAVRMKASMSRKADCWDNAVAESFFGSLKRELEGVDSFETHAAASLAIGNYIDGFYNLTRSHSTLNYMSPIEFELASVIQMKAA